MSVLEFQGQLRYPTGFQVRAAFQLEAGVTSLFGPSGSGKTSILSMIAGMRLPDNGRIRLSERILFDSTNGVNLPPEARRIGCVFQEHLLFPHLSVRRNLQYGWKRGPKGASPSEFQRAVDVLELGDVLDRLPHTLSGGQSQRVAIGRALLCQPELLLLDEPLASLDAALKERVLDHLERVLVAWRIPTLHVTHDAAEVVRLSQRVIILENGQVKTEGVPAQILGSR